jgi:CMP/dCMP kinase
MKKLLITIDGPAGAGKTTVSRMLADCLGYRYVDTGALYRGVAWAAQNAGVVIDENDRLEKLLDNLKLEFIRKNQSTRLMAGATDITDQIRTPQMSLLASAFSAKPIVRARLLSLQHEMGRQKAAVFEGRDMGTVVFPEADFKFFLDASLTVRAQRRFAELAPEKKQSFEKVAEDIKLRDNNDKSRAIAPLRPAEDAFHIDSSAFSAKEVVTQMQNHIADKTQSDLKST